jgi:integrase/recombinase XerD
MRLYPEAARLYVAESGFISTEKSKDTYLKVMRHCQSQYPGKNLDEFTTQDLASWCMCLRVLGNTNAAGATVRKRMGHLRGSFRWWRWRGLVDPDPAVDLPLVVRASPNAARDHTWLDESQVAELLNSYDMDNPFERRDRLILLLGMNTGLRLDALASLTWDQFHNDFTELRVVVKGNKRLTLPVMDDVAEELRAWRRIGWLDARAVIPSIQEAFNPGMLKRQRTINWDRSLGEAGIYAVVKKAGRKLGVELAPHDMRRTFAGWLEDQGLDLRLIQSLLGHENIATTAGYLERNPARLRRAVTGLRRAL